MTTLAMVLTLPLITGVASVLFVFLSVLTYLVYWRHRHNSHDGCEKGEWGQRQNKGGQRTECLVGFNWFANPRMFVDAAENGWEAFSFVFNGSPPVRPPHSRKFCAGFGEENGIRYEISWDIASDGTEYMQKLRLIPGSPSSSSNVCVPRAWCLQAALPLPGPLLDPPSFPFQAYFEITILPSSLKTGDEDSWGLKQGFIANDTPNLMPSDEPKSENNRDCRRISVGLSTIKGATGLQPGLDAGSVGLHSSGCVLVNGAVHVHGNTNHLEKFNQVPCWGDPDTIIGCGFDPLSRNVFFTLNGEMVYSLICKSDEFYSPMFPTVAANHDITLLINYGQSQFKYAVANKGRVTDPCFRMSYYPNGVKVTGPGAVDESCDLFSIGRADSQFLGNTTLSGELFDLPIEGRK